MLVKLSREGGMVQTSALPLSVWVPVSEKQTVSAHLMGTDTGAPELSNTSIKVKSQ